MNRRNFIELTIVGSSALFTQSCKNWGNQTMPESKTTTQQKVRVRYSLTSTEVAAQRNVENFKKAVQKMKALSKSDPANKMGWIAQAEIHYKYCGGADPKIDIHRTSLFPPWHRAYLFFFEEICRHILNDTDFALPYWDWSKSPYMPEVFGNTVWDEDLDTF